MASQNNLYPYRHWLVLLWLTAFVAFHVAWSSHASTAFTLNGFDLAEQIRVHPAMMAESPALRTSIFIWFVIPLVSWGLVTGSSLYEKGEIRWILRGASFLIALRLMPPEWAFRNPSGISSDDYAMTLTGMTALGLVGVFVTILLSRWLLNYLVWIELGLCGLGILIPMMGLNRALGLLHELQLQTSLGAGAVLYGLIMLGIGGLCIASRRTTSAHKLKPSFGTT